MDKKAKRILFNTYWSAKGWKDERIITPEDFNYAKSKGLMFDNITISTQDLILKLKKLLKDLKIETVVDAFLCSLTNKRLDWRSGIASYINVKLVLSEKRIPSSGNNYVYNNEDINVLNFERIKWAGVRHSDLLYNYLDLSILNKENIPNPTEADKKMFLNILRCINNSEAREYPSKLRDRLKSVFPSSKDQRHTLIDILGCCEILQPMNFDRPVSSRHDWSFVECWRGEDKYNKENLEMIFGKKFDL